MKKIITRDLTNMNLHININDIVTYNKSILNYTKLEIYLELLKKNDTIDVFNNIPHLNNNDIKLLANLGINISSIQNISYNNTLTIDLKNNINQFKNDIIKYLGIIIDYNNQSNNNIINNNNELIRILRGKIDDLLIIIEKIILYKFN